MIDPQVSPKAIAGAKALVMHRMMQGRSKQWDELSDGEKLNAISEAVVVLEAAAKVQ